MHNHSTAIAAAIGVAIGGIAGAIDHVLSFAAVVTAASAAAARYMAILLGRDQGYVDRATAKGFFVGVFLSALFLSLDRIPGG